MQEVQYSMHWLKDVTPFLYCKQWSLSPILEEDSDYDQVCRLITNLATLATRILLINCRNSDIVIMIYCLDAFMARDDSNSRIKVIYKALVSTMVTTTKGFYDFIFSCMFFGSAACIA